jgi:exodeoxyribonuclease-3
VRNNPHYQDEQQRLIAATIGGVRFICAYVPNGQAVGSDKYAYKMGWLAALRTWVGEEWRRIRPVRDPGRLQHRARRPRRARPRMGRPDPLLRPGTRAAARTVRPRPVDAFRLFEQPEKQYSWWDYRQMAFRRNRGLRIDHILLSPSAGEALQACVIDREPRKWEQPSDHTPVIATIA